MDTAGPGMKSLTPCQANKTKVAVTVRRDMAGPGMESLTCCQANRTRVAVRTVRRDSWTWHGITHSLSSQWDKSGNEDSKKGHS